MPASLLAQRDDGIDPAGAPCRQIAGEERYGREQQEGAQQAGRVAGGHSEHEVGEKPAEHERPDETEHAPGHHEARAMTEREPLN
jgi:hypothetical protein